MKVKKNIAYSFISSLIIYWIYVIVFVKLFPNYYQKSVLLSRGIYFLDISFFKMIVSFGVFILVLIIVFLSFNKTMKLASDYFVMLLFLLGYTPGNIIFFTMNLNVEYFLLFNLYWLTLFFSLYILRRITRGKKIYIGNESQRSTIWVVLILLISLGIIYIFGRYSGFRFNLNFNVDDIYELRIKVRGFNIGKFADVFRNNTMYIAIPFAALIYLYQKKYIFFGIMLVLQAMLYSVDNQKAALFLLIVSLLVYLFLKDKIFYNIPNYLMSLGVFQIIFFNTSIGQFIIRNFFERILFLPAILGAEYYNFFSENTKVVPFVSMFKKLGLYRDYPYNEGISYIMGDLLFFNKDISANTGGFGVAYSYGLLGMLLIAFSYAFLISLFDLYTSKVSPKIYMSILFIQVFVMLNVSIFVVVSSYGLFLALLLLSLVNDNKNFNRLE